MFLKILKSNAKDAALTISALVLAVLFFAVFGAGPTILLAFIGAWLGGEMFAAIGFIIGIPIGFVLCQSMLEWIDSR